MLFQNTITGKELSQNLLCVSNSAIYPEFSNANCQLTKLACKQISQTQPPRLTSSFTLNIYMTKN